MNINKKIKENNNLKKKAVSLLSKAIAKILLKFRLPRSEFINLLDEKLVLEAKKQDPKASKVALAIRTGIDRRYIGNYLNGNLPEIKPDRLTVILEDIRWTADKFYHSNKIPKLGPFRTFQSICEQRASGSLTYRSILNELVKNGNIADHGNKVELLKLRNTTPKNELNYTQITAVQLNRVVDTIMFNLDTDESDKRNIQRTIHSTQIHPNKFNELHQTLKDVIEKYDSEVTNIFISYEDNVAIGTHPEYGFSFLEYNKREQP